MPHTIIINILPLGINYVYYNNNKTRIDINIPSIYNRVLDSIQIPPNHIHRSHLSLSLISHIIILLYYIDTHFIIYKLSILFNNTRYIPSRRYSKYCCIIVKLFSCFPFFPFFVITSYVRTSPLDTHCHANIVTF
jgi:predicted secreted protein